jgi:hypothetical protein
MVLSDPSQGKTARPVQLVAFAAMTLALAWPALANRFPIVFYDTGGYLARSFEGTLLIGRSAFYGAILALGIPLDFWPIVIAQSAATVWLILLFLRQHGFGDDLRVKLIIVLMLAVFTGLPWYSAQLMPDIMAGWAVVALYLLAFRIATLGRIEKAALVAMIVVALPSHMAILALTVALALFLIVLRLVAHTLRLQRPALRFALGAVAMGVMLAPLGNFLIVGKFAFTPGGMNFVFSRLVQDGIVQRYLAEQCPDPTLRICAYKDEIPMNANDWLWDEPSPLFKLGGVDAFEPEARRIVFATFAAYPWTQIKAAVTATALQFVEVGTGDGLTPWTWHVQWELERFAPGAVAAYRAARQQQAEFDFSWLNAVHIPAALLSIAILATLGVLAWRRRESEAATRALFVFVALGANASICGALSNPTDRYQSRLIWIAPLCVLVAARNTFARVAAAPALR